MSSLTSSKNKSAGKDMPYANMIQTVEANIVHCSFYQQTYINFVSQYNGSVYILYSNLLSISKKLFPSVYFVGKKIDKLSIHNV